MDIFICHSLKAVVLLTFLVVTKCEASHKYLKYAETLIDRPDPNLTTAIRTKTNVRCGWECLRAESCTAFVFTGSSRCLLYEWISLDVDGDSIFAIEEADFVMDRIYLGIFFFWMKSFYTGIG